MNQLVPSDVTPYIPPGRPVPRFVAALGVLAAGLVALMAIGPLRLDLEVPGSRWTVSADGTTANAVFAVQNHGRFAVEVGSMHGAALLSGAVPRSLPPEESETVVLGDPLDPVRIGAGASGEVGYELVFDCDQFPESSPGFGIPARLDVRTVAGVHRTIDVDVESIADSVCHPQP